MISPFVKKENNIVERVATRSATKFSSTQQIYTHQSSFVETNPNAQQRWSFFFFIIIIGSFNNWNGERNLVMRFDNETNFCYWFVFSKLQILDKWLSTFKYHVYTSLNLSNYNWLNLNKYFFFLQYINTVYPLFVFCISTMFVLKKILIFGLRNNTLVLNFC